LRGGLEKLLFFGCQH